MKWNLSVLQLLTHSSVSSDLGGKDIKIFLFFVCFFLTFDTNVQAFNIIQALKWQNATVQMKMKRVSLFCHISVSSHKDGEWPSLTRH